MPKLTIEDLVDALKMLQSKETLETLLSVLEKDQDKRFNVNFLLASFVDPRLFQGFLVCYYLIHEKMYQKTAA